MDRLKRFLSLRTHPLIGKDMFKLKSNEILFCVEFIVNNQIYDDNSFCEKANRLGVEDNSFKVFRNNSLMWSLLIQSVEPNFKSRRI